MLPNPRGGRYAPRYVGARRPPIETPLLLAATFALAAVPPLAAGPLEHPVIVIRGLALDGG